MGASGSYKANHSGGSGYNPPMIGNEQPSLPVVLLFSGLDPTGGAGIQADIEAVGAMGAHPAPLITANTRQDTHRVMACYPTDPKQLLEQAETLLDDVPVAACKIGLLSSASTVEAIHKLLQAHPDIPLVLDPVLTSGGGDPMADAEVREAMLSLLLPRCTLLTPNSPEARSLSGEQELDAAARRLMELGADYLLITGTHEQSEQVTNTLYHQNARQGFHWERLPGSYHGSGCTLAAACAALIAREVEPVTACAEAQAFTWESLKQGFAISSGQRIPNRLHRTRQTSL